jgi:hypothetical protein
VHVAGAGPPEPGGAELPDEEPAEGGADEADDLAEALSAGITAVCGAAATRGAASAIPAPVLVLALAAVPPGWAAIDVAAGVPHPARIAQPDMMAMTLTAVL